jgi:predicted acyltransferase
VLLEIAEPRNKPAGISRSRERMVSLDALRGATIAAMILVNNPGRWSMVYSQLRHAPGNGWTFTDCVFPFFLFIVGVSIVFSFAKRTKSVAVSGNSVRRMLRRACILFGLGLLLNGFPFYDLSDLRIPGVLQRIAVCYLAAALITLKTRISSQVWIMAGILIAYWLMLRFIPVPGVGAGSLEQGSNLASYVDGLLLRGHLWYNVQAYDPEGILSTIPAIGTTLFGVLTGHWLRSSRSIADKAVGMFVTGLVLLVSGQILNIYIPINKGIWTSSYAVFMAGMAMVCLAVSCWLIDVKGHTKAATPFVIFGMNAITAYVFSELLSKAIRAVEVTLADGRKISLKRYIFNGVYAPWGTGKFASMIFAWNVVFITFLLVWWMWRKQWFLKV